MAFHPNTVARYLQMEKVIRGRIELVEGKQLTISLGRVGELDKTNIKWRKITDIEDKLFTDYGFDARDIIRK